MPQAKPIWDTSTYLYQIAYLFLFNPDPNMLIAREPRVYRLSKEKNVQMQ